MLFAITCVDKPGNAALRQATQPRHRSYLQGFKHQILLAGPLLTEDGRSPCGTLMVMDFPDKRSAATFAEDDPYAKAGLFGQVSIRPFRKVLP